MSSMRELIDDLNKRKEKALEHGGKEKVEKLNTLGFNTARERIEKCVDSGSFIEFGMLNHSDYAELEEKSPADGMVAGLARVSGREVVIFATDKTVFAGTGATVQARKTRKLFEFAVKRGLPIFTLVEGGGLRMPDGMGSDGISTKTMSKYLLKHCRQVPLITGILGDSYGSPTWKAVSSDFTVQLKGTCMAVSGPRMLEVATGERISTEELGGWKLHAEVTGQVDEFGDDEEKCIEHMKRFLSYMPSSANEEPPVIETDDDPYRLLEEALDIVPTGRKRAYNMKKLINTIVDKGSFFELKPYFGEALITGLARLNGKVVGIIANQPIKFAGAAGPNECDKATDFICLCDSYNIPIIFLHDIPGFRVGSQAEQAKMPTKIMVWNQALAHSTVPKISVVIRKSIGAAYSNMCGTDMGADFVVAWPSAEINFTGPEVGINVVYGRKLMESENPSEDRKKLLENWGFDSSPYKAAGKHLLDDVIDPRDTRKFLCQTLEFICSKNGTKSQRLLANWPTGF
ncbi:acyl-CoA carboxylase subunit beta [Peribacillus butanolivorans]|uniref:acyl-CoA carboxylase subunit beta n=1 Tax=Peribacillus butanolivorans TaxID=421767 RepID=UPI00364DCF04